MFKIKEVRGLWSLLLRLDNPSELFGLHGNCGTNCHSAAIDTLARNFAERRPSASGK